MDKLRTSAQTFRKQALAARTVCGTANPDRLKIPVQLQEAIEERQATVAEEAAQLFGRAHTGPDGAYFSYQTEVGAAKDAVRALVGELLAANPYLIHQIEAAIHTTQQAQEGEA